MVLVKRGVSYLNNKEENREGRNPVEAPGKRLLTLLTEQDEKNRKKENKSRLEL